MIANEARREDEKIADIGAYVNEDVVGVDAEFRACPGGCEAFRRTDLKSRKQSLSYELLSHAYVARVLQT
jgi:hypothetical protein